MGSESLAWRGKERSVREIVEIAEDRFRDEIVKSERERGFT